MGAAVGAGCGGEQSPGQGPSASANPGAAAGQTAEGGSLAVAIDAACGGQLIIGFGCSSTCRGTPDAPTSPLDCAHPQELECDAGRCLCDPAAPLAATDCATTAQFTCDDWSSPCGCRCNDAAVVDPVACCGDAGMEVGMGCYDPTNALSWSCESYDPPIGCDCRRIAVAIL